MWHHLTTAVTHKKLLDTAEWEFPTSPIQAGLCCASQVSTFLQDENGDQAVLIMHWPGIQQHSAFVGNRPLHLCRATIIIWNPHSQNAGDVPILYNRQEIQYSVFPVQIQMDAPRLDICPCAFVTRGVSTPLKTTSRVNDLYKSQINWSLDFHWLLMKRRVGVYN